MNTQSIISVKTVRADQWRELREIRLEALRDSPQAFATTAAQAEAEPDEYWAKFAERAATGDTWATFLAYADNERPVGMVSVGVDPDRPGVVGLIQMWVNPAWRKRSIGSQLVEAVVSWASGRSSDRIRLGVASDNHRAAHLFENCGFLATGEEEPFEGQHGRSIKYYERIL